MDISLSPPSSLLSCSTAFDEEVPTSYMALAIGVNSSLAKLGLISADIAPSSLSSLAFLRPSLGGSNALLFSGVVKRLSLATVERHGTSLLNQEIHTLSRTNKKHTER